MRYVSFHKMKKDYTFISDIQKYFQKSNKLKLLNTSSFEYFPYEKNLQSIQKLAEKGVELTTDVYQSIEYLNGKWKITAKNSKD